MRVAEFGDKRVIRRAVYRHKQIEKHQRNKNDNVVEQYVRRLRKHENASRHNRKRHGDDFHKRYASAALEVASVRPARNHRVCHRVEYSADHGDKSEQRYAPKQRSAGDVLAEHARLRVRVIVNKPVADNARKQTPTELTYRKDPQHFVCYLFHFALPPVVLK